MCNFVTPNLLGGIDGIPLGLPIVPPFEIKMMRRLEGIDMNPEDLMPKFGSIVPPPGLLPIAAPLPVLKPVKLEGLEVAIELVPLTGSPVPPFGFPIGTAIPEVRVPKCPTDPS